MGDERPLVRLEDLSGEDCWAWAVQALSAVADADSLSDAYIDVGRLFGQLEPAALLDVAITLAVVPRFGLATPHVGRAFLDDLAARMAFRWADPLPHEAVEGDPS